MQESAYYALKKASLSHENFSYCTMTLTVKNFDLTKSRPMHISFPLNGDAESGGTDIIRYSVNLIFFFKKWFDNILIQTLNIQQRCWYKISSSE